MLSAGRSVRQQSGQQTAGRESRTLLAAAVVSVEAPPSAEKEGGRDVCSVAFSLFQVKI